MCESSSPNRQQVPQKPGHMPSVCQVIIDIPTHQEYPFRDQEQQRVTKEETINAFWVKTSSTVNFVKCLI